MHQENLQKQKILIVDDSEFNRSILTDILGEEYEIFEAVDGVEAIAMIQRHAMELSAVLLDIVMPRMDGFEVLTVMNQKHWIEDIPVIIISAESGSGQIEKAYNLGATDFIMRPFDAMLVHRRVVNTILLYTKQKNLISLVIDQIDENEHLSNVMVDILSHIVEFRNGESGLHIIHIRTFTEVMLRQLQRMTDRYSLTQADIAMISLASALHDIGKIAIDEKILNKPGRLTKEEFEAMKKHSLIGAQMLENLPTYQDALLVKIASEICRWHHERYDGRGYPDGLVGDDIPISAQVVALADVYDALTSERCYKKAFPHETAIQMIMNGECGTFNPLLLDCLRQVEGMLDTEFSRVQSKEKEISHSRLINELLYGDKSFASKSSQRLLDKESMKYDFISTMTEEIYFEYTAEPSILTLSSWGAKKLGLDEVIVNPMHNEKVMQVLGEDFWKDIHTVIHDDKKDCRRINYECRLCVGGQPRWYRIAAMCLFPEDNMTRYSGVVGMAFDINDAHMRIEMLEKKAALDVLTGLLNHTSAKEQILKQMEEEPDGEYVLAVFDLDYFKSANDTYGHLFGDSVLKQVAANLRQCTRKNDIVARIGGDEFLIFLR
ncbi:MAG: diguanylate cyclase [Clostridia bacterium]|nr:diguanylate cyclase [Clostridia bacterium]